MEYAEQVVDLYLKNHNKEITNESKLEAISTLIERITWGIKSDIKEILAFQLKQYQESIETRVRLENFKKGMQELIEKLTK